MIFCARVMRGLTRRRRLRSSNNQSDQSYSQPVTSTLAVTFRWAVRSRISISRNPTCLRRDFRACLALHAPRMHTTEVLPMRRFRRCL